MPISKLIIDVREPQEYQAGHIEGALNIPIGDLAKLPNIPKDTALILYCHTGTRANLAVNTLRANGYTNVVNGINQQTVTERYL